MVNNCMVFEKNKMFKNDMIVKIEDGQNEMVVKITDGKKLNGHLKTGSKQKIKM